MAQKVLVQLIDDLDGTSSEDVMTVQFGLDGVTYEIDLSESNADRLRDLLADYVTADGRPGASWHPSRRGWRRRQRSERDSGMGSRERHRARRSWPYSVSRRRVLPAGAVPGEGAFERQRCAPAPSSREEELNFEKWHGHTGQQSTGDHGWRPRSGTPAATGITLGPVWTRSRRTVGTRTRPGPVVEPVAHRPPGPQQFLVGVCERLRVDVCPPCREQRHELGKFSFREVHERYVATLDHVVTGELVGKYPIGRSDALRSHPSPLAGPAR
jgi:hypothetical protein